MMKYGSKGANVALLQKQLIGQGYKLTADGDFGDSTEKAVLNFQKSAGLKADGLVGSATLQALNGQDISKRLKDAEIIAGAKRLGVDEIVIRAIAEVETQNSGFLDATRPVILFERHRMFFYLKEKYNLQKAKLLMAQYPNVVNTETGGYRGGSCEYIRLNTAKLLDEECALQSASWGRFQLMGENWKVLGYSSVQDFVEQQYLSEGLQFEAFLRFCEWKSGTVDGKKTTLLEALKTQNWHAVFSLYNGTNYKKLGYDTKFQRVMNRLTSGLGTAA